jgi:transcriptional regulator with XRE-family HTH domain
MVHVSLGERILKFERGAKEPSARMILALAQALTADPMQLLFLPNGVDLEGLRLASGRSAADLAQSVHVSMRAYLSWEAGHGLPLEDRRILAALARELNVSSTQIVTVLRRRAVPDPHAEPNG